MIINEPFFPKSARGQTLPYRSRMFALFLRAPARLKICLAAGQSFRKTTISGNIVLQVHVNVVESGKQSE